MRSSAPPEPSALRRAARLSLRDWLDVVRAFRHLATTRMTHRRMSAAGLLRLAQARGHAPGRDEELARRVAAAIPRAAARVPWRSDCFVQALAAQDWLARRGIGSELHVGVRTDTRQGFAAHAWLRHGDITVTGGDFSAYQPIAGPKTPLDWS
jgi:hypothetical protein